MGAKFIITTTEGETNLRAEGDHLSEYIRKLDGQFVLEIRPVTASTEAVLFYERQILDKYLEYQKQQGQLYSKQKAHMEIIAILDYSSERDPAAYNTLDKEELWYLTEQAKPIIASILD